MKKLIVLILSSASVFGADTSIRVVTKVSTNESGSIITREVFTRDGQTNLMRETYVKSGAVEMRNQLLCYRGLVVGGFHARRDISGFMPDISGFTSYAGPYQVGLVFAERSKDVTSAHISTRDGIGLDFFDATNGVFYPGDISALRRANDILSDIQKKYPIPSEGKPLK